MDMTMRAIKPEEIIYTYTQQPEALEASGCIGHLRGDMDSNGHGFFTSWDDHQGKLKTESFKAEFDDVVNTLRFDDQYGSILKNRSALTSYGYSHPEASFGKGSPDYGVRIDTEKYSYLVRCNPNKGEYNFYVYAYERSKLNRQLSADRAVLARKESPYPHSAACARENGELEQYRASYRANVDCKTAIEDAIHANYKDNRLNSAGVLAQLRECYSMDRIGYVLAATVQVKEWDGRIDERNKVWAKTIPVVDDKDGFGGDRRCYFVVDQAHTGLVNLFVTSFRKEHEKALLGEKTSVLEKLQKPLAEPKKNTEKSKGRER